MKDILIGVLVFLLLTACASAVYFWFAGQKASPVSTTTYLPAPPVKAAEAIPVRAIPAPKTISVMDKNKAVAKLKLPDAVKSPDQEILATGQVQPYAGKTSTVAVMDTRTGQTAILTKQDPLPFLAFTNDREVYVRAGYTTNADVQVSVGGRWRFLRVGQVKFGAYAEASSRSGGEAVSGVEISY